MGQKRTKVIGIEEFEGLMPEDLLKKAKKSGVGISKEQLSKKSEKSKEREKKEEREARPSHPSIPSAPSIPSPAEATQEEVKKVVARRKKIERKKGRSRAYQAAVSKIDRNKFYKLEEAIEQLKKISFTKFDQTVELHVHTVAKKGQDPIRFRLVLPSGAVKQPRVRIIDEVALQDIEAGKIDFDIPIATPAIMPKLAKFAKILGPRGLMPNPKAGTVTDKPEEQMERFRKGQIEVRADSLGNIHVGLAKLSWETPKIAENVRAVASHIQPNRIGSITLTSTMAPGLKVAV